jgi:hypothetical protein
MLGRIANLRASGEFASPRESAHHYPDLCSHFWSVTRVLSQGLLFFGRSSGHIASPAQRERPPTEGRRVRASAHVAQAPRSKPCLPSPGALHAPAAALGEAICEPSRVLSSLRVGVHFLYCYGCSRRGVGGLSRNLGNDERESGRGRGEAAGVGVGCGGPEVPRAERPTREARRVRGSGARKCAGPLPSPLPAFAGRGNWIRLGVASLGFHGKVKPFGCLV